jgi:hypothetical protein
MMRDAPHQEVRQAALRPLQGALVSDWADEERLARLRHNATSLRQRTAALAASIAETEDDIADTFDRIARIRPRDAERLRAKATQARQFAAHERNQAALYGFTADIAAADPADRRRAADVAGPG